MSHLNLDVIINQGVACLADLYFTYMKKWKSTLQGEVTPKKHSTLNLGTYTQKNNFMTAVQYHNNHNFNMSLS